MSSLAKSLLLLGSAATLAVSPVLPITLAHAQQKLPSPYVSRAFDAVLLPLDQSVRSAFNIAGGVEGVLVLAVEPGGVADSNGVEPGDIIAEVRGKTIVTPIDLDEVVYYWLINDVSDFGFNYYRAGTLASADVYITLELYESVVDVSTVSSWTSWSYESFSYEEYSVEYSEEFVESYESSETTIEETVTTEEYSEEVTEEYSEEVTEEETTEEEISEEEVTDEDVTEDDVTDEDVADDAVGEEEVADDEVSEDDAVEDDSGADESADEEVADDDGDDSGGDDSGGDDAGGDEE